MPRSAVEKRPQAIRDLADIAIFLAEESRGDVRMWRVTGFPSHLIFYRQTEGGIEIIRVLHAKRDIDALFGGRSWPG